MFAYPSDDVATLKSPILCCQTSGEHLKGFTFIHFLKTLSSYSLAKFPFQESSLGSHLTNIESSFRGCSIVTQCYTKLTCATFLKINFLWKVNTKNIVNVVSYDHQLTILVTTRIPQLQPDLPTY